MKIGVFVCHCGTNIEGTVDTAAVAAAARIRVFRNDTMYACSEPGQDEIIEAIKEHKLDGVVVASCTTQNARTDLPQNPRKSRP